MDYLVVIEKTKDMGNYGAYVPDVLGCVSTGQTVEETERNIREALEFHFEGMAEDGERIPEPSHRIALDEEDFAPGFRSSRGTGQRERSVRRSGLISFLASNVVTP